MSAAAHERLPVGANGIGESGSLDAGPGIRIGLVVDLDGRISAAGFELVRFDDARTCAETVCELIEGATVAEAGRTTLGAVLTLTGRTAGDVGARIVHFALRGALQPFLRARPPEGADVVCTCFGITRTELVETITRHDLTSVEQVREHLPATHGCGTCRPDIADLLTELEDPRD